MWDHRRGPRSRRPHEERNCVRAFALCVAGRRSSSTDQAGLPGRRTRPNAPASVVGEDLPIASRAPARVGATGRRVSSDDPCFVSWPCVGCSRSTRARSPRRIATQIALSIEATSASVRPPPGGGDRVRPLYLCHPSPAATTHPSFSRHRLGDTPATAMQAFSRAPHRRVPALLRSSISHVTA